MPRVAEPEPKSTSDWKTKRSPTTRISGRSPRASRSRPKKSEIDDLDLLLLGLLLRSLECRRDARQLLAKCQHLAVQRLDLVLGLLGQPLLLGQFTCGLVALALDQQRPFLGTAAPGLFGPLRFLGGGEPRLKILRTVADGTQVALARLQARRELADPRFQIVPHLLQRVDVAQQADGLGEPRLQLHLGQGPFALGIGEAQLQRVALAGHAAEPALELVALGLTLG